MERIYIIVVALLTVGVYQVTCDGLMVSVNTGGFNVSLQFQASGSDVICSVETNALSYDVVVTIHPVWMNYDVKDRCNEKHLGSALSGKSGNLSRTVTTFTLRSIDLDYLEGKSVVLTEFGTERHCATIWNGGHYTTAVAIFKSNVLGSVYFRQEQDNHKQTTMVSKLVSTKTFNTAVWKITDAISSCDDLDSVADAAIFNPVSSKSPAHGDLSGKGFVSSFQGTNQAFSNSDLPLNGDNSIANKYLVVYDGSQNNLAACAQIRVFHTRKASALFSHQGIHGHISFTQASPLDITHTSVMLEGLNKGAKGYHVHVLPVPTQTEKQQELCSVEVVEGHFNPHSILVGFPDPTKGTDDQYEVGDLSSKYGTLSGLNEVSNNYTDWNLPLFGKNSIVGRSLVIHRDDAQNSRWVCSNILPKGAVVSGVATFSYPVYGQIYFTQAVDMPYSDTWIFSNLRYLDEGSSTAYYLWQINSKKVGDDMVGDDISNFHGSRCASTGTIFDPTGGMSCTPTDMSMKCKLGDLSGRLGELTIAYKTDKTFYTDTMLSLSGHNSILGKSVVIMHLAEDKIMGCASIERLHGLSLKSEFDAAGISGSVSFTQEPGFGQRPTMVSVMLSGFDQQTQKLQIHSLPPAADDDDDDDSCKNLGSIYNPLEFTGKMGDTHDLYQLGDLSRGESQWKDLNLPLSGITSIRNRSLAVVDSQSKVVACGIIQAPFSKNSNGYLVTAKAVFKNPLQGYIQLSQTLYDDGSMSDTSVLVDLKNTNGVKSPNHNWHTHKSLVSGDAASTPGRCVSTGPHYDPFAAKIGKTGRGYAKYCSMFNPLRCELGDQASKLGAYSLGDGKKLFTDVDLPLNGMYKVQGRSFVVHVENKGAARYSCANINAISHLDVMVKFKTPTDMDMTEAGEIYAKAAKIDAIDIVVELVTTTTDITTVKVHFIGLHRNMYRGKFLAFFGIKQNREGLSKYAPLNDPNSAGAASISMMLILITLLVNFVLF